MTVIRFTRPGRPLSLNDRHHWTVRSPLTLGWRTAAHVAALHDVAPGKGKAARAHGPSFVHVEIPMLPILGNRQLRDPSNYIATVKPIVDGLTDAGLWPDDHAGWVTILEPTIREDRRASLAQVVVTITPRKDPQT